MKTYSTKSHKLLYLKLYLVGAALSSCHLMYQRTIDLFFFFLFGINAPKLHLGNTCSHTTCSDYKGFGAGYQAESHHTGWRIQPFAFGSATQSATATRFSFISGSTPQTGRASFSAVSAGLPLTPATQCLVTQLLRNQLFLSTLVDGSHW